MSAGHHRWLLEQIPVWEKEGLLTPAAATSLRERSAIAIQKESGSHAQALFGAFGGLLVGTGILVLIGYNWDTLSRSLRLILSFLPLLIGQAMAFWILWRSRPVAGWIKECVCVFQFLSVGACLAMVSQIYQAGGDPTDLLLVWSLLTIPMIWLLRSHAAAVLYLFTITAWAIGSAESLHPVLNPWLYPVLVLLLGGYWPTLAWRTPPRLPILVRWAAAPTIMAGLGAMIAHSGGHGIVIRLLLLCAAGYVLLPVPAEIRAESILKRPFSFSGATFLICSAFVFTFSDEWTWLFDRPDRTAPPFLWWCLAVVDLLFAAITAAQGRWMALAIASLAATAQIPFLTIVGNDFGWIFTAHLFLLSLVMMLPSFFGKRGAPRMGALLLSILVLCRFSNFNVSLLIKGLVFVAVGAGFIFFNIFMARRKPAS